MVVHTAPAGPPAQPPWPAADTGLLSAGPWTSGRVPGQRGPLGRRMCSGPHDATRATHPCVQVPGPDAAQATLRHHNIRRGMAAAPCRRHGSRRSLPHVVNGARQARRRCGSRNSSAVSKRLEGALRTLTVYEKGPAIAGLLSWIAHLAGSLIVKEQAMWRLHALQHSSSCRQHAIAAVLRKDW